MDFDAQHLSMAIGAVVLFASGLLYPKSRGRTLIAPVAVGVALGTVVYPLLLGLVMGYSSALQEPARLFWPTLWDVGRFYAMAPVIDTMPRGAALGLLTGLVVGLRRAGAAAHAPRPREE